MKFVDEASIYVEAGSGGRGSVSFRRAKFIPRGGPDGGDGGKGGDVIVAGKSNLASLLDFRYKRNYKAENGTSGGGKNKTGKNGTNSTIYVPLGTIVYKEPELVELFTITKDNEQYIAAHGGRGGRGNTRFVSSTHRAPLEHDEGEEGKSLHLKLVLKLLADVGLVGLPNAGKSTLISRLTEAKPKVGDYPFTTLSPALGVLRNGEKTFVIADIPGIIEGASIGKGLGLTFLRHIERTKTLLILLDVASPSVKEDYDTLIDELKKYKEEMLRKERIVILNKADLVPGKTLTKWEKYFRKKEEVVAHVSALTGQGVEELKELVAGSKRSPAAKDYAN
jgi:GTP-binding protein